MFTHTIKAIQAIAIVFVTFSASAQAYHQPIRVDNFNGPAFISNPDSNAGKLDSNLESHLQFSVTQNIDDNLKFRVIVMNPLKKGATIAISHNDDVYYLAESIKGYYQNLFDLSQLEDGSYQLIVTNGKEKISKEIVISTSFRTDRRVQLN